MTLHVEFEQVAQMAAKSRDWVEILSALLTPIIAVLAIGVAGLQWWTNRRRLKHELFDRRYALFVAVRDFLRSVLQEGKVDPEEERKFLGGTRGMRFIFDQEIAKFVDETLPHLTAEFHLLNTLLDDPKKENERPQNAQRRYEIFNQINKELQGLEARFAKYMQLGH